jgi:acyl carrier protein
MNCKITPTSKQIEKRVVEIARELSGVENIDIDTQLLYLGLRAVNFLGNIRQEFGVELRFESAPSTLKGIADDIVTTLKGCCD